MRDTRFTLLAAAFVLAAIVSFAADPTPMLVPTPSFPTYKFYMLPQCQVCLNLEEYSQGTLSLSPDEDLHELDIVFYNGTIERTEIQYAPIIVYVYNSTGDNYLWLTYTGSDGVAPFDFDPYSDACHDYQIIYCHDTSACGISMCFESAGLDPTDFGVSDINDIPMVPGPVPEAAQNPATILPASASYHYCPPPPPVGATPVFCLPLILIASLLMGALYMSGKNPFAVFDFSAPRMGKYVRYTARGRGFGFDLVSIAAGATTVVGLAKNPKAMAAKNKQQLRQGGAFGGIAGGVRGGVLSAGKGIKGIKRAGGTKGLSKMSFGQFAKGSTTFAKLKSSAIGRIVSGAVSTSERGGSGWDIAKGVGMGIVQSSSLAPVVGAIQNVAAVWKIDGSVGESQNRMLNWRDSRTVTGLDGRQREVEMRTVATRDEQGRVTGAEMVATVHVLDARGQRTGESSRISMSDTAAWQSFLTQTLPQSQWGQLSDLRTAGYASIERYHATVQFYVPLEITRRSENLAQSVLNSEGLKGKSDDEQVRIVDRDGRESWVTVGEIRAAAAEAEYHATYSQQTWEGMEAYSTSGEYARPESATVNIERFTMRDSQGGTTVVNSREEADRLVGVGMTIVSSSSQQMGLNDMLTGMSRAENRPPMTLQQAEALGMHGLPISTPIQSMGLGSAASEAQQISNMQRIVMESRDIYSQLQLVGSTHSDVLEKQRESVMRGIEDRVKSDTEEGRMLRETRITVNGEEMTIGAAMEAGHGDHVFAYVARQEPESAPAHMQDLVRDAYRMTTTEAQQMGNLGTIYSNAAAFTESVQNAGTLSSIEVLRAQRDGDLIGAQLSAVTRPGMFDVNILDIRHTYEPETGTVAVPMPVSIPGQPSPTGLMEMPVAPREGMFERIDTPSGQPPITEEQAINLQRSALQTAGELLGSSVPGDPTGQNMRTEKAILFAFSDMGSHPEDSMRTLGVFTALAESRDDPARFNRMYDALNDFTITRTPETRQEVYERVVAQDSLDRFGDVVRGRAIDASVQATEAFRQQFDTSRQERLSEPGIDQATREAREARFSEADQARSQYEGAHERWSDRFDEMRRQEAAVESMRSRGASETELATAQVRVDSARAEFEQAQRQYEQSRDTYYSTAFRAMGGSWHADELIREHSSPGMPDRTAYDAFKAVEEQRDQFRRPEDVVDYTNRVQVQLGDRTLDPFASMRTPSPLAAQVQIQAAGERQVASGLPEGSAERQAAEARAREAEQLSERMRTGDIPQLYGTVGFRQNEETGQLEPSYRLSSPIQIDTPPGEPPFRYDTTVHEQLFSGAIGAGATSIEDLRAKGLIR